MGEELGALTQGWTWRAKHERRSMHSAGGAGEWGTAPAVGTQAIFHSPSLPPTQPAPTDGDEVVEGGGLAIGPHVPECIT